MSNVMQAKTAKQWFPRYKRFLQEAAKSLPTPTPDGKGYPIQVMQMNA
jgi:hypothetical protein